MPLSAEDTLRINVMLANNPLAIRIDESRMQVWSLGDAGDARIDLCPNCRDDHYLKQIRELLSGQILGSPGGYPVYIKRWTRMGQMRDDSLEHLMLLGEPEAVIAAVHAEGLTDELARRAWWVMEDAENARQMLQKQCVVNGKMGAVLADWLIEFLPFETEAEKMMESVRLVLQANLISQEKVESLWKKARRKPAYYVGFLSMTPDSLPLQVDASPGLQECHDRLVELSDRGNALAGLLLRTLLPGGQAWLQTLGKVLQKPNNQDVVNTTLDVVADYFSVARPEGRVDLTLENLQAEAEQWLNEQKASGLVELLNVCPTLQASLLAVRVLSGMSYGVVRPVFQDSSAIGSLMRKKLAPVFQSLTGYIEVLQGENDEIPG